LKLFQEWEDKVVCWRGEFKYGIFDIVRTFINATVYPHPAQQGKNNLIRKHGS
jgi:hypothetical protein